MMLSALLQPKVPTRTSSEALAATAGNSNWKSFVGRSSGSDDGFEPGDLFRLLQRYIGRRTVKVPPPGTTCPVCFTVPDSNKEWYITESCHHAVCVGCLERYADVQARDRSHVGPLRCPICPRELRSADAVKALGNNPEALAHWDAKLLDSALQDMPGYVRCPQCSAEGDKKRSGRLLNRNAGVGFVTTPCLIQNSKSGDGCVMLFILTAVATGIVSLLYDYIYRSVTYGLLALLWWSFCARLLEAYWLPRLSVEDYNSHPNSKAVKVTCPQCKANFPHTVIEDSASSKASAKWMKRNSKRCPNCKTPINKNGGCNHMQCTRCNQHFCWACQKKVSPWSLSHFCV